MLINKTIAILLSTLFLVFNSNLALAADDNGTSNFLIDLWPFLVFFIILIVFRKKLIAEATAHNPHAEHHAPAAQKTSERPSEKKTENELQSKLQTTDLNDNSNQCQAATAKGTRCKRTSNLEQTTITNKGTNYQLTVCKQHNTGSLQPYSKFVF